MPIEAAPTAPTLRDTLVAAMDTVVPEESIPAQEKPAVEPSATAAPETATSSPAPAQESEAEKAERLRNKDGTFAKGKTEAKPAEVKPVEAPAKPKTPRPSSWKKELESYWDTLPPEIQTYVGERERQYATGVSTYKNEAERASTVMKAIEPYVPMLEQHRIPVDKWIGELGTAHRLLSSGTPQERVYTVANIIRNNGIDAQALVQILSGQQPQFQQQQPQFQQQAPQLSQADIEAAVEKKLMLKEVDNKYNAFTKDVEAGKHPHYEEVKGTMAGLLQAGLADDYASAYEAALRHPRHAALFEAAQQQQAESKEAERKAAEQAKVTKARSQAVSVKSSTPSAMTQATGPKSLRDQLSDAYDKSGGRV